MKYLFIFLPFFAFGQDTIAFPDGDTIIHGKLTYGGNSALYGVRESVVDTCWEIKDGWMSLKPGCISSVSSNGGIINFKTQEFYVSDRKPKVVESFKYLGAYYELRENGWYKEVLPDTISWHRPGEEFPDTCWLEMGGIRVLKPGCSETPRVESWKTTWIPCDQHIGKTESYRREKMDTSEVKLLVWNGCSLSEIKATKLTGYNRDERDLYWDKKKNTLSASKVDFLFVYISDGKWIKPSHVIKEL